MSLTPRFSPKQLAIWVLLLLILGALSGPQGARAQGKQVAFEDAVIGERVRAAINDDATLGTMGISVSVQHRVVRLEGTVNSPADLAKAEALARAVRGVSAVTNSLRLSPYVEYQTDDVYSTVAFDVRSPVSFFARRLSSR